ncbi:MAG: anaerobic sulfatase maturase [Promethearchaeota archaeon]
MKPFSLLIKPAGADCNLRCKYCFYIDHLQNEGKKPRMSDEILEKMISSYMATEQNGHYVFGWQGGEPTLMGIDFFKKVVKLQQKYGRPGSRVSNGLQTNATLISSELAEFFGKYKFLLGVSLDGPPIIHDHYRKTRGNTPTHELVMKGIEHLKKNNVEFNILVLVNDRNVKSAKEVYEYLVKHQFYYHQYIPCVEYDEKNKKLFPFSITGEEWGDFLCEIFDIWIKNDVNRVSIRHFDSILEYFVYGRYNVCYMNKDCRQYFVVEHDGGVYPCDFFVRKDLCLGNILTDSWEDLLNSPIYYRFGTSKSAWNKACNACPFISLCHGDCQKFRVNNNSRTLSVLCTGWKKFYAHSLPYFQSLAKKIRLEHDITLPVKHDFKKIGRNDACPCGSGRKYKNCCMLKIPRTL